MAGNYINEEGAVCIAQALETSSHLISLDLGNNFHIGSAGVTIIANALEHNKHLQRLYIFSVNADDECCAAVANALERNSTLQYLDLSYNKISARGVALLAHGLARNHGLKTLELDHIDIIDSNALVLAQALNANDCLQWIRLRDSTISEEGKRLLWQAAIDRTKDYAPAKAPLVRGWWEGVTGRGPPQSPLGLLPGDGELLRHIIGLTKPAELHVDMASYRYNTKDME